ncbi:MAG: sodium:alanine symporter family protein [Oscillospiraceae bacterium]|nr:sodium:alanine symporter family protein [Oscillospiraceae bacterium]
MFKLLEAINSLVWGVPLLVLISLTGVYISIRCGFPQIKLFPEALRRFCMQFKHKESNNSRTSYRALCNALAATVGTGNLAGVAGAIAIGGPGAIFWMWVFAFLGMATKFAEATLAVIFQRKHKNGEPYGGPMYIICDGLPNRLHLLAYIYAFFGVVASFGVGNASQVNAMIGGIQSISSVYSLEIPSLGYFLFGVVVAVLVYRIFSGGSGVVADCIEKMVPIMSVGYVGMALFVILKNATMIPVAFSRILSGAFQPDAVTGGVVGSALTTLRIGASRGVFTNEAGMGTASIAHSTSKVEQPVHQGLMGIIEVFLDTILICTLTALVILCSGIEIPFGEDMGVLLTANAFIACCGKWVAIPLTVALCLFAIATMLGWGMYGVRCAQFLFGDSVWKKFVILQAFVIIVSTVLKTETIWILSDIVNGLMAMPNLIALFLLCPKLATEVHKYTKRRPIS